MMMMPTGIDIDIQYIYIGESSFVRNTCPNIGRGFDEWAFKVEKLNLNLDCLKTRSWAGVGILVAWRQEEIE